MQKTLQERVFLSDGDSFQEVALEVFHYQYTHVAVYREFCDRLAKTPAQISVVEEIPCLPVSFFKSHDVIASGHSVQKTFQSSATSGTIPSRHLVADLGIYEQSFMSAFEMFYGAPAGYCFLALLPSYMERGTSSLLYMADHLIRLSGSPLSGFILRDFEELRSRIHAAQAAGQVIFLLGVTYALLDFAEQYPMDMGGAVIMETGGMKGRREEMTRAEIHGRLKEAFHVPAIHSEYGMTELLSQAYSTGDGIFRCPPWMRVSARDPYDPLSAAHTGQAGVLNVIDLANLLSCSFLAVSDLGRVYDDGSFEVIGRIDHSEIRGCNLMYEM